MNYLSGGKKSILGTRLSSRYLSSDAFTSSTGKTGGRSISRLGSLFGRKAQGKRFSGTGQRIGLFELKNIFLKGIFILTCCIVIGYTIPYFRYSVHRFFAKGFNTSIVDPAIDSQVDKLSLSEYYIAPVFGQTDRFIVDTQVDIPEGSLVYSPLTNHLIGVYMQESASKPYIVLLSEVGQRNNFFIKTTIHNDAIKTNILTSTATTSDTEVQKQETGFTTVSFEGLGYGQLKAQVPPQEELDINTILYLRTEQGLVPAAQVSFLEKDTGSTFTNVYAQLLIAPFELYKVRIDDAQY